jgi:hypothetical protein
MGADSVRRNKDNESNTRVSNFLTNLEQCTKELVCGDFYLRSTDQILDELDNETNHIDHILDVRMERERYLRILRRDLKELREIELRKLDLMHDFIHWATDEVTALIKSTMEDSESHVWRQVVTSSNDGSSLKNGDWLEEKPTIDGNASCGCCE